MIAASEITSWWDRYLRIDEIEDYPGALNGLQVECARAVGRIGAATDACQATIDLAADDGCDLLLVHHGLFWGGPAPLVGPSYRRVSRLIESGMGLYSSHLPLDVHPEIGNNTLLAEALDLVVEDRFGSHGSVDGLGVVARVDLSLEELVRRVGRTCGAAPHVIRGGADRVETLAIVTGGAGSMIAEAAATGADAFLTGEGNHHTHHEAMELGLTVIYAGHYATETFGVRRLAEATAGRFDIEARFYDVPTGL